MERRDFLKTVGVAAAASPVLAGSASLASAGDAQDAVRGEMRYRQLGTTGVEVSIIGVGGFHIGMPKDEDESTRIVRTAIDRGVTFMDNCRDYHDGLSEKRMGTALRDGYREKVFLMTKIDGRTRDAAAKQLDESLERLETDHVDLLQFHEMIRMEDADRVFAKGGALEAVLDAKEKGKVRFIGFTGHKDPAVHLRVLEVADAHDFHFDTAQMPINVMDAHFRSFGAHVVPDLLKRGTAVLGMKPMGSGEILKSGAVKPIECLHYAMSQPTSVVITGIDSMKVLDQALEAVRTFQPLTQQQTAELLARTAQPASQGQFEPFKTNVQFDSTALHPQWLG
jgi:predicted aldo/keto reductase-like oxidoreductase